jgi:hypothetical protein
MPSTTPSRILAALISPMALFLAPMAAFAAEQAPAPILSNVTTRSLPLVVQDLANVASGRLYVTADSGATWTLADEITVKPDTTPRFTFTAAKDGTYGFVSAVTYRDGNREAEPKAGTIPLLVLQIDTQAPAISSFTAEVAERSSTNVQMHVTWAIADEALSTEPVTIEASLDGGASFAPIKQAGSTGNLHLPVAVPQGTDKVHVRLSAKDLAGNLAVSATQALTVPKTVSEVKPVAPVVTPVVAQPAVPAQTPATGDAEGLAQALAALPKPTATVEPVATPAPVAAPAPAPTATPAPAPVATPAPAVAAAPAVDPNRPDIVVPTVVPKETEAPAEIPVITGGGLDQEYAAHQAAAAQPAAATGWQRPARTAPAALAPADASVLPSGEATAAPEAVRPKPPSEPVLPAGIPPAGRLSPHQADQVLSAARTAASNGNLSLASARYRRLRDSQLEEGAILEEIRLYREAGDSVKARGLIAGLSPAQHTDAVTIEDARCLLALNRPADAMGALTTVKGDGPNGPEAFFVIGQTFKVQGRTQEARKVFTYVAQGSGPWADAAKLELTAAAK